MTQKGAHRFAVFILFSLGDKPSPSTTHAPDFKPHPLGGSGLFLSLFLNVPHHRAP